MLCCAGGNEGFAGTSHQADPQGGEDSQTARVRGRPPTHPGPDEQAVRTSHRWEDALLCPRSRPREDVSTPGWQMQLCDML